MTRLRIDHVTVAASELQRLERAFAAAGLDPVYGGRHANGVTHMSIVGFQDGSYIELIAPLDPGADAPVWTEHMRHDGGPCGWAIGVDDIAAETARATALGVPTRGPVPASRRRPDDVVAEWDMAFLGDGQPGALLPFMIRDRTPRENRVPPAVPVTRSSGSAAPQPAAPETAGFDGLPRGVAMVILGVSDLYAAARLFRTVYS
ncbi:MAG: VOC family protein, partial [Gemmatimonadaceae bacterium]